MLCVNKYKKDYVAACRSKMEAQLKAYKALPKSPALAAFEPLFFGNLILAMDAFFVHRSRGLEGKDGNPLNEVRMICNSILANEGVMTGDKTIKWNPETSTLKLQIGSPIRLNESDFVRLYKAYFAEMEARFI